jgi:DNA polymerase-3 subunit epsilon
MIQDKLLTFIDLETTGGKFQRDRVIEIGIIQYLNGELVNQFETLVNPECFLPSMITKITGIRESDLVNAPTFEQIYLQVYDLIKDSVLVAHNVNFDYGFLKAEFDRFGISLNNKTVCSVRVSRLLYPEHKKHSLDSIIERFNFSCDRRHRALDDAKVIYDFFQQAISEKGEEEFLTIFKKQMQSVNLPPGFTDSDILKIPDTCGVYIFYGDSIFPLYIGKSINLRTRINSHFQTSKSESKEFKLFQSTTKIDYFETSGELSALLLESKLVKELKPLYNRKLRREKGMIVIKKAIYNNYYYPKKEIIDEINPEEVSDIIGIFSTLRHYEKHLDSLAIDYGLCPNYLYAKFKQSMCFNYDLNMCEGACIEAILPEHYNKIFNIAFESTKIQSWPFRGLMMITEYKNPDEGKIMIFNNWCLVSEGDFTTENLFMQKVETVDFNKDIYNILRSYVYEGKNFEIISYDQLDLMMETSF